MAIQEDPFLSVGPQTGQAFQSEIPRDDSWRKLGNHTSRYKDIFGQLQGRNIVFCLDTSGSMYEHLPVIVEQLLLVLKERLDGDIATESSTQFNLVTFAGAAQKWALEPVTLTPESLGRAATWLKSQSTGTSTNTLDALLQAFADCTVDTVYLVTDGLPDQRPAIVIECVLRANRGRPVVCVSIGAGSYGNADLLLTDLASVTGGCHRPVSLPLKLPDPDELAKLPKGAVVLLHGGVLDRNLRTEYLRDQSTDLRWTGQIPPAYPTVRDAPPPETVVKFPVTAAGRMLLGKAVLARHPARGDYRSATVIDQHGPDEFEVEFPGAKKGGQLWERCKLVHLLVEQDARMHPVTTGDHVLAPLRPGGPYEPGNVVRGADTRRGTNYNGVEGDVMVVLYSGLTVMCRAGTALWIPHSVYNRMVTELRIVPSPKCSVEAIEVYKLSERNVTLPSSLGEYITSRNNGPSTADVCGKDVPKPTVAEVPGITPVDPGEAERDEDDSDRETIQTTMSELQLREEPPATINGELPGYLSGVGLSEGRFDEILGVPDHPRFREVEDEDEGAKSGVTVKPGYWKHAGKATASTVSPLSRPLRVKSAVDRSMAPSRVTVSFKGSTAPPRDAARPGTVHTSKPAARQLQQEERERGKEAARQRAKKMEKARARVAHKMRTEEEARAVRAIEIAREVQFRESKTGQAIERAEEKRRLKNAGSHQ